MTAAYLQDPKRLGDVIAAIQAMGSYKFYKLDFGAWADRIAGDPTRADHWRKVFEEHPEFFRLNTEKDKASLVWRRQHRRRYHVDRDTELSDAEYSELTESQRSRISRLPLQPAKIGTLVKTAIDLHSRTLEHRREKRWWIPVMVSVVSALSALLGVVLGALL